jgi:hypothetical protein
MEESEQGHRSHTACDVALGLQMHEAACARDSFPSSPTKVLCLNQSLHSGFDVISNRSYLFCW